MHGHVCETLKSTYSHCTTGKMQHHVVLEEASLHQQDLDLVIARQLSHTTRHINTALSPQADMS